MAILSNRCPDVTYETEQTGMASVLSTFRDYSLEFIYALPPARRNRFSWARPVARSARAIVFRRSPSPAPVADVRASEGDAPQRTRRGSAVESSLESAA
jgi:hypothetical protein